MAPLEVAVIVFVGHTLTPGTEMEMKEKHNILC